MFVTPSLTYMAEATSSAGSDSFGVAYGLYNFAWSFGLLIGPALGGALYERLGFVRLCAIWAVAIVMVLAALARAAARVDSRQLAGSL